MTKQKLIALIINKQSYKQLKPTINQISKQNIQSVKNSVNAILQILTKQYNAESKLYALRFLKDCFEAGSKNFIKSTSQDLLPIITNIVIDSTDQQAITKYAGSSFTKSTDLQKFKSIMVSFFKLAKECIMKWAEWVSNPEFKFAMAYSSLQKKGIRFQAEFKYFRPQNQVNFHKKCKENCFPLIILNKESLKSSNNPKLGTQKIEPQKPIQSPKQIQSNNTKQKPSNIEQIKLSKRHGPKGKSKYILKCHQIFKNYDQKLKNGTIQQNQLEQMNSLINSQLEEYMAQSDLDQNQMESQLTVIFENIKNVKEDFAKMKQINSKAKLTEQTSQIKGKKLTITKTENINSNKKIQTPQSPIHQLTLPNSHSPRGNPKQFQQTPSYQDNERQIQNKKTQGGSIKQVESPKMNKQIKIVKKKIEVFEDDSSFIQSQIEENNPKKIQKRQQKVSISSINSNNRLPTNNVGQKIQQSQSQPIKQVKSPKHQQPTQIHRSVTKATNKSSTKQKFDSNIEISHSQSSRVDFSQSSIDDQSSNDEGSRLTGNFKKEKTDARLSSIIEEHAQHIQNSSRRHFTESEQESSVKKQVKQKDKVIEKIQLNPNEIKVPKQVIDQYESKIKALETHLREKQSRQRELQKRLTELNTLKRVQEEELQKIREENSKILERFSNAVDPEEYAKIKKDFEQMKVRNRKMEGNMDKLTQQIEGLKVVQKQHQTTNIYQMKTQNKQNHLRMMPEPNNLFQNTQNIPAISSNKKVPQSQKPKFTYHPLDPDYIKNRTHLSKLHEFLDQNNLTLIKKNIIGASELFFNSEEMSFICRMSPFKIEHLALKLELSFKFNGINKKDVKPIVTIPNLEEIEVWKKNITGEDFLYHQEIVVKLKNFPFKLLKLQVSTSEHIKKSVVLPFLYFSFLRKCQIDQEEFDRYFSQNKDSAIKSKVFNLNSKVVKDFKSLHFYQGFSMPVENRMCFRICEKQQKNSFWCELTNLSKQKCILKIVPDPYSEEMYVKAEELMHNLIFLLGGN